MNKKLLKLSLALFAGISMNTAMAQTAGTLTVTFTEAAKPTSTTYNSQGRHVLASWIQNSSGTFVKTKLRYCCNNSTSDHLPTWANKSSNGSTTNAGSSACNNTDATTGATQTSFTTRTFTWDGKNVNGTANGTIVPDGTYSVVLESCWAHGTSGIATKTINFTKGSAPDTVNAANDATFTNVKLIWTPSSTTGIDEASSSFNEISVYPNPNNTGLFTVSFEQANSIRIVNTLGDVVHTEKVQSNTNTAKVDISNLQNGVYFFVISDENKSTSRKVILNK